MSQTTDNQQQSREKIRLRPYRSPRLLVYGPLRELTAAGSGPNREFHAMSTNMRRQRP